MRPYLVLFCFFIFIFPFCAAQTIEEAFNLRFLERGFSDLTYCRSYIDSTQQTTDGFHPIKIEFYNKKEETYQAVRKLDKATAAENAWNSLLPPKEEGCSFLWSKTVILPDYAGDEVCIFTLQCKTEIDSVIFIVRAFDRHDNPLSSDSVLIRTTNQWMDHSLSFQKKQVRAAQISIRYHGEVDANEGLGVYLSRVKMTVGNQEINDFPVSSLVHNEKVRLHPNTMIPLLHESDKSLAAVTEWSDKKIIGLGEQIEGLQDIQEIQIELMKHLITSENCKLILLPLPEDFCVRWNLFLQGKQGESFEIELLEELEACVNHPELYQDFLKWLQLYNAQTDVPVRIVGIYTFDEGFRNRRNIYMTDYLLQLSTRREDSIYFAHAMYRHEYPQVKEYILDSDLSSSLLDQDFKYLLFLMEELIQVHTFYEGKRVEREKTADRAKRIEQVVTIYLPGTEKGVFLAPSRDINKRLPVCDRFSFETDPLGSYLLQQYGSDYHAVSIQVGERIFSADTLATEGVAKSRSIRRGYTWMKSGKLNPPLPFTFEAAGIECGVPYFYYSTSQLPEGIVGFRRYYDFHFCTISSHFDGLIFLKEAKGTHDFIGFYSRSLWELYKNKGLHLDQLIKLYKISSN